MAALHVYSDAEGLMPRPTVRKIGVLEILDALRLGWIDFRESRPIMSFSACSIRSPAPCS